MNDAEQGWYYLHTGGDVIWKGAAYTDVADLLESDFVVMFWPFRAGDREAGWTMLVEALAAGANEQRVRDLADQWRMDDADAHEYCKRINVSLIREEDGWAAIPERTPANATPGTAVPVGRSDTILDALASLATAAGWRPGKAGRRSFPVTLHGGAGQPVPS